MSTSEDLELMLARVVEHHLQHGVLPPIDQIAAARPELTARLRALAHRYLDVTMALDGDERRRGADGARGDGHEGPGGDGQASAMPPLEGFRTIERLGAGGMGEVYKLRDLRLHRDVAAKIVRGRATGESLARFLREAQSLALFSDPRIVRIFDCRTDVDPPVILMEYVDGFELGRVAASLEFRQRARIVRDVCESIQRAHALGLQHRDLKPSNILLDSQLAPKIVDFGLSGGDPRGGHFRGTLHYLAPEQLDAQQPIDARTDVYALGVILYELLCGTVPYRGETDADVVAAIRGGRPRLPVEIDPKAPEPLQAIALKAMELQPADRYQTAHEMLLDLDRYLGGLPVVARPRLYAAALSLRVRPHLDQIAEWLRLKLIYPHEAARLSTAYRQLEAREDDWIVASRALSYSQIALYLGAFFLFTGAIFFFIAQRVEGAVRGVIPALVVLGIPFAGLNAAGRWLYRRDHKAVAVACFLAGVSVLPLLLLIWLHERGLWVVAPDTPGQLFPDASVSNRQLQITIVIACAWAAWLAFRTATGALSTVATVLACLAALALLADFGLRDWIESGQYDRLALHLAPLVPSYLAAAWLLERSRRAWFSAPCYIAASLLLVAVLDLLALDGRLFQYLGLSLREAQPDDVSNPVLLDTLAALSLNGVAFYAAASLAERRGTASMSAAAQLLFVIAPFSMLEPLAMLSETMEYSKRFDWLYLMLAVGVALLSHQRQRRSFYYAGIVNAGVALYLIALRNEWFDRPAWAIALVAAGILALLAGFVLDFRRRNGERTVAP
jgi:serine/threonine protein kinase